MNGLWGGGGKLNHRRSWSVSFAPVPPRARCTSRETRTRRGSVFIPEGGTHVLAISLPVSAPCKNSQ